MKQLRLILLMKCLMTRPLLRPFLQPKLRRPPAAAHTLSTMCYQTTCSACKKPSWAGCGRHIESVGDTPTVNFFVCCMPHVPLNTQTGCMHACALPQALRGVPVDGRCKCKPCTQAEQDALGGGSSSG